MSAKKALTAQALTAAQLMADGHRIKDIVTAVFGVTYESDNAAWQRGRRKLAKWEDDPDWQAAYQRFVRRAVQRANNVALLAHKTLERQLIVYLATLHRFEACNMYGAFVVLNASQQPLYGYASRFAHPPRELQ